MSNPVKSFLKALFLSIKRVVLSKSSGRLEKHGLSCTSPFVLSPNNLARILYLCSQKTNQTLRRWTDKARNKYFQFYCDTCLETEEQNPIFPCLIWKRLRSVEWCLPHSPTFEHSENVCSQTVHLLSVNWQGWNLNIYSVQHPLLIYFHPVSLQKGGK